MEIKEIDKKYIANTYKRFDVVLEKGKGSIVYDNAGKKYIDLGGGIAVNIFGIGDEQWKAAVIKQLNTLTHTSNLYFTEPQALLAQKLCEKTGMKKVFFSNSGAEANECAIKTARKYGTDAYGNDHNVIICLKNSFHGRTMATLSATGQDEYHKYFYPFVEGFVFADADDFDSVKKLAEENNVCAIMMELVQGEGGVRALNKNFVTQVAAYAKDHDLLLIIDEVQTGNGRSGSLYAYMNYGISPDIVSTAKGIGGGLPIGATLMSEKCQQVMTAGTHGSTFGGNPVCAAGAVNILDRIDESLLQGVQERSKFIIDSLTAMKNVKAVSGLGLMIGADLDKNLDEVVKQCQEKGVLVLTAHGKLRLLPALNIPMDELKEAMKIIKDVIDT